MDEKIYKDFSKQFREHLNRKFAERSERLSKYHNVELDLTNVPESTTYEPRLKPYGEWLEFNCGKEAGTIDDFFNKDYLRWYASYSYRKDEEKYTVYFKDKRIAIEFKMRFA